MGCGCSANLEDGKSLVDHVKSKGKQDLSPAVKHEIKCDCGNMFTFEKVIMNCPHCGMTYGVTPCSSSDINKIKQAGKNYA